MLAHRAFQVSVQRVSTDPVLTCDLGFWDAGSGLGAGIADGRCQFQKLAAQVSEVGCAEGWPTFSAPLAERFG